MAKNSGLVYSSDGGRMCPGCRRPKANCVCSRDQSRPGSSSKSGAVYLKRETKGRKGAGVTLVTDAPLGEAELKVLAKELKKKCGVGGAVKNGVIEIQGDQRAVIKPLLEAKGWQVKLAGG